MLTPEQNTESRTTTTVSVVNVRTMWLWLSYWVLADIFITPLEIQWGWLSEGAQRRGLEGDVHIAFFILCVWLCTGRKAERRP